MLQQTQVSTVLGYFGHFMAALPDVEALTAAAEDKALCLRTGFSCYSRTRNLHKTTQTVVGRYTGEFPHDVEQLAELPGINRSTVRAIANLPVGPRTPILDDNVKCVLARYLVQNGYPGKPKVTRAPWEAAERFVPYTRVNHYTQVMMDLGATLYTYSRSSCLLHPLVSGCHTYPLGREASYPQPRPHKTLPQRRILILILTNRGDTILLYQRPSSGLWDGFWDLPELGDLDGLEPLVARHFLVLDEHCELNGLTYTFGHLQLAIEPWLVTVEDVSRVVAEDD